jgi:hypothetical protein
MISRQGNSQNSPKEKMTTEKVRKRNEKREIRSQAREGLLTLQVM